MSVERGELGGDPAGNIRIPCYATTFFCANAEAGDLWLSETRAKSQNRDHSSLVLRTRREQDLAWPPGCRGDFGSISREKGNDTNTSSCCVCAASGEAEATASIDGTGEWLTMPMPRKTLQQKVQATVQ